jgi:hypothetical protein
LLPLDARLLVTLALFRLLPLLRLLSLFGLLALCCLTFGGLTHRFLRALGPLTILLLPALPICGFALLRIFALLSLAHLPVSIHSHAIGYGPRFVNR